MSATIVSLPRHHPQGGGAEDPNASLFVELRRARIRIAQLEASLTETMRDNLANYNRARDAERRLEKLGEPA